MSHPFRYTFILGLVALGTALAAVGGWRYARASAPVSGPIILISIDTLRADHLPAYGYQHVKTPAIDALAADAVVFERAYSHAPQTLPAHASLLSGRLPFETGVRDNVGFSVKSAERLLPEMLRDRGYQTGGIVSSYVLGSQTGISQGFDFFDGNMPQGPRSGPGAGLTRDGGESERVAESWLTSVGTERAFLFLHLYEPHKPYTPPPQFAEYAPYDGEIAYVDQVVGRLMKHLKAHQLYDQSTIILVSDHGEGLGDHGEQEHGLFVYDDTIRVPLIIKPAAGEGAGRRVSALVQHVDLVPTILDLAKAPIPDKLRGRSLKPLLEGTGRFPARLAYSESLYARYRFGWSGLTSVTDGRYQFIKAPREELYDLQQDPTERRNILGERGSEHSGLIAALDQLTAGAPVHAPSDTSPDNRARLAALGYVGVVHDAKLAAVADPIDPKDRSGMLETYRVAMDRAVDGQWSEGIDLVRKILRDEPDMADLWHQLADFAVSAGRFDLAADAYRRASALSPSDPAGPLGAAGALLSRGKLDEARQQAELAASVARENDSRTQFAAYELLAKIAIARRDPADAREQAVLAHQAEPKLPMPAYIEGRLLHEQGRYDAALPFFRAAIGELARSDGPPMPELHFYAADTLVRLQRLPEAESHFLEELRRFPQNVRARGGLAVIYHTTGRTDEAGEALTDLVRITPTPEAYTLAARLWTTFGNRRQAARVRAEAQRSLAPAERPVARHAQ